MAAPAALRGRTIFALLSRVWSEYENDYARYFAAAMVYYALVALVPLILLLLSALGLLLRFSAVAAAVEQDVLRTIESGMGAPMRGAIGELLDQLQHDSVIATAIGVGALLVTAAALFKHLRMSFRAIWKYKPPIMSGTVRLVVRSTFLEQVFGFALILVAGALLMVAIVVLAIAQWLGGHLERLPWLPDVSWLVALPTTLVILTLTFAALFRFLPPVRVRWRHIWIGAIGCGIACMVASEIVALYGLFFGDKFNAWSAVGGLMMIMLWMNVVSQILFYGAELCKVMSEEEWVAPEA
jgi:membrane protein